MKSKKQIAAERTKRRAHIRRGMKIALYEVKQALARQGLDLFIPPNFVEYTTAIAEAGRRHATQEDHADEFAVKLKLLRAEAYRAMGLAL